MIFFFDGSQPRACCLLYGNRTDLFFFSEDGIFVTAVVSFFFLYSIYIDAFFFPGRTKYIDLLNL